MSAPAGVQAPGNHPAVNLLQVFGDRMLVVQVGVTLEGVQVAISGHLAVSGSGSIPVPQVSAKMIYR